MKVLEKVKKGLISFGIGFMMLSAKVSGSSLQNLVENHIQIMYGPPQTEEN